MPTRPESRDDLLQSKETVMTNRDRSDHHTKDHTSGSDGFNKLLVQFFICAHGFAFLLSQMISSCV